MTDEGQPPELQNSRIWVRAFHLAVFGASFGGMNGLAIELLFTRRHEWTVSSSSIALFVSAVAGGMSMFFVGLLGGKEYRSFKFVTTAALSGAFGVLFSATIGMFLAPLIEMITTTIRLDIGGASIASIVVAGMGSFIVWYISRLTIPENEFPTMVTMVLFTAILSVIGPYGLAVGLTGATAGIVVELLPRQFLAAE